MDKTVVITIIIIVVVSIAGSKILASVLSLLSTGNGVLG